MKDLIEMNDCHVSGCGIFFDFGGGFWNEEELQIEIEGFFTLSERKFVNRRRELALGLEIVVRSV